MTLTRSRLIQIALATLVVAFAAWGALSLGARNEFAGVVSIEQASTYQDASLLARAWQLPVAAAYRAHEYDYQRNASYCGPTSVVNVLHTLGRTDATQDNVLDGTEISTIFGFLPSGLTLDELASLLRLKSGLPVEILRGLDLAAFRAELARTNDPARRYLINFTRGPLFGRGHGHHSPVLGYLAEEDLVFVGDVNRDYGPWLVKADRLFEAMDTIDDSTGKKRGLLVVTLQAQSPP